jgi:hypothetical protein
VQTFVINVTTVNDAPSFTKPRTGGNQTINENAGAQSVTGWATNISVGPANESGQTVSFEVNNDNNGLFSAQPAVDAAGKLTFTSASNANGTAIVTLRIKDNGGTANGGVDTSSTQSFTITVNQVDDAPNITAGSITRKQNAGGSVSEIATVSDIDTAAGNLMVSVLTAPTGIVISSITNTGGTISATVAAACNAALGANTVVLQVSDGNSTANAYLTVTVTPSNAPVITLKPFLTLPASLNNYRTITINQMVQSATDDCNGNMAGNVVIEQATSDEAENSDDDGNTFNDMVIGTDCRTVQLSAERSGAGNGRVYTITLRVSDSSGNNTRAAYKVFVPHGSQTPIDDGAVYTVNSSCP